MESLRVSADRRERRLELVADRKEEGSVGLLGLDQLVGHVVERSGEHGELVRPLHRNVPGRLACGQPSAGGRHPADRAEDRSSQDQRCAGGHDRPDQAGDQEAAEERLPIRGRELRPPNHQNRSIACRSHGIEDVDPCDGGAPLSGRSIPQGVVDRRGKGRHRPRLL